ncbi:hypothetical protein Mal4_19470 [Maioricimonas rarisocia]|uniref:Uncharacterized protein n=1 Tax=Maioricimonas rarisocia TaxID=2528026 RepID=A0A517Z561_9PLAN|nr:hypothetical protein [Maioricimonas rarisocia]QDU37632.1 hypothetical protein Mal4_19470 [Maioricimonas rarisocia]
MSGKRARRRERHLQQALAEVDALLQSEATVDEKTAPKLRGIVGWAARNPNRENVGRAIGCLAALSHGPDDWRDLLIDLSRVHATSDAQAIADEWAKWKPQADPDFARMVDNYLDEPW